MSMSSLPMLKSGMSSVVTIAIFLMFKYSLLWYFLFSLSWEVVPNHCYFLPLRWCYLHILSDWYFLNQFSLFLPESSPVFFYDTFCIQSKQMKRQNAPLSATSAYRKLFCLSLFCPSSGFLSMIQVTHQDNQMLRHACVFQSRLQHLRNNTEKWKKQYCIKANLKKRDLFTESKLASVGVELKSNFC